VCDEPSKEIQFSYSCTSKSLPEMVGPEKTQAGEIQHGSFPEFFRADAGAGEFGFVEFRRSA
jgi:hypothetical protein